MKILKHFRNVLAVCGLAFAFAIISSTNLVQAADEAEADPYHMRVSPAKAVIEEKLEPGKTYRGKLKVSNDGTKKFTYRADPTSYAVDGEKYTPVFDKENDYNKIREWVILSQPSGELQPGESAEVEYTIEVPKDANSGGQYAGITIQMIQDKDKESEGTGFEMTNQIGFVIYAEVDGEIEKTGSIVDNKISGFRFSPPISATSVVENTGNTHFTAKYTFKVLPFFGDEELHTNEEEPQTALILPDTRYMNTMTWEETPSIGIFRVQQTVQLNDENNTQSTVEKIVIVCPVWLIFVIALVLFVLIFWIVSRARGRKNKS